VRIILFRRPAVSAGAALFLSTLLLVSYPAILPGADEPPAAEIVLAAARSSRTGLRSGQAEGEYAVSKSPNGSDGWTVKYSRAARLWFDSPKYRLELSSENPDNDPRKSKLLIIVFDGESLAYRNVSDLIRPEKEEVQIRPSKDGEPNKLGIGVSFNPSKLATFVADVEGFVKNNKDVKCSRDESGIVCDWLEQAPRVEYRLRFPKEFMYNVSRFEVYRPDINYRQVHSARWGEAEGVWYVRELERSYSDSVANTKPPSPISVRPGTKHSLRFSKFDVNVPVDPSLFTLASLHAKPGSRVLDIHPESHSVSTYRQVDKDAEHAADVRIEEAVKALPKMLESGPEERPRSAGYWKRVFLVSCSVCLALTGVALLWRRYAKAA
jgi:hypothetical protein